MCGGARFHSDAVCVGDSHGWDSGLSGPLQGHGEVTAALSHVFLHHEPGWAAVEPVQRGCGGGGHGGPLHPTLHHQLCAAAAGHAGGGAVHHTPGCLPFAPPCPGLLGHTGRHSTVTPSLCPLPFSATGYWSIQVGIAQ